MVVMKLFVTLRPHSVPLYTLFSPKFPTLSLSSFTTKATANPNRVPNPNLSYGPSLSKGTVPSSVPQSQPALETLTKPTLQHQQTPLSEDYLLDEEKFVRIFDIAALRVPSRYCFEFERRLRGHLLNWPRIPNIARVPGDEVVDEFAELVGNQNQNQEDDDDDDDDGDDALISVNRRIYGKAEGDGAALSPVLYREKLVKTFDSRGFVNFRNLARISRPKRRRKKKREEEKRGKGNERIGRGELAVVEIVEDEEQDGEDMKGLLGDEFVGKKWRGSTRLLLLDERCANQSVEELPEAIKVAFSNTLMLL